MAPKRKRFSEGYHLHRSLVERQHLRYRIERDDNPITKNGQGRSGSGSQVEELAGWQPPGAAAAPGLLLAKRQNPVQSVVTSGDPGEDLLALRPVAHGVMASKPTYGWRATGIFTEPSAC